MAKNQQGQPDAKHGDAAKVNAPVPPTHVIVDKLPSVEHSATKPGDTAKAPEEKPLPRFARPEWVIVYITAIYVVIAAVTLIAIWRQADLMKTQAGWMQEQTGRMSRQADLMNRSSLPETPPTPPKRVQRRQKPTRMRLSRKSMRLSLKSEQSSPLNWSHLAHISIFEARHGHRQSIGELGCTVRAKHGKFDLQ